MISGRKLERIRTYGWLTDWLVVLSLYHPFSLCSSTLTSLSLAPTRAAHSLSDILVSHLDLKQDGFNFCRLSSRLGSAIYKRRSFPKRGKGFKTIKTKTQMHFFGNSLQVQVNCIAATTLSVNSESPGSARLPRYWTQKTTCFLYSFRSPTFIYDQYSNKLYD